MKDVCVWAAVDDEMWNVFAGALGDASLQNLSLLASMQLADINALCTRLLDLDPIDVGAPPGG